MNMTAFLSLFCAVLSFIFYYKKSYILSAVGDAVNYMRNARNELILIVIVSSQDHFAQRQSLRDTWLTLTNGYGIKHYFLIGETVCPVHPKNRISTLECEEHIVSISENSSEDTVFKIGNNYSSNREQCSVIGDGFTFIIHHDIVVHHLGIQATALLYSNSSVVRVVLSDSLSHKKIVSATFHESVHLSDEYLWKRVHPVVLPAGFEGQISIHGLSNELQLYNSSFKLNASNGCISIMDIMKKDSLLKYSGNECSLSSFSYTVKDIEGLRSHMYNHSHRQRIWNISVEALQRKLQKEAEEKQDILFVDMIDVYRKLPVKMIMFYEWLVKQNTVYQHVLKTDDDTFVNVHKVIAELQKVEGWDWWSCFRIGWPVQRTGKWKEVLYNKTIYPPFPSGSGYVLKWNVIETIAGHGKNLERNYQGEDVALGIWLEEFSFVRHIGTSCYWACNENCHENTCNAAQLSIQNMHTVWKNFKEHNKIICPNSQ